MANRPEQVPQGTLEACKAIDLANIACLGIMQNIMLNQPLIYGTASAQLNVLIAALPDGAEKTALQDYMTANAALGLPAQVLAQMQIISPQGKRQYNPPIT